MKSLTTNACLMLLGYPTLTAEVYGDVMKAILNDNQVIIRKSSGIDHSTKTRFGF